MSHFHTLQQSNTKMTRAACNVIVNITKLCLSYRSIKVLKRPGNSSDTVIEKPNHNSQNETSSSSSSSSSKIQQATGAATVNDDDLELLQLWSLIAFLTVYDKSGVENFLSFFPLYYYFKMILLIVTAIPATKFPNFWCDVLLIPMMQKCHELMDVDWKTVVEREGILLPFRILNWTIMPGLLCDESFVKSVRRRRVQQLEDAKRGKFILFDSTEGGADANLGGSGSGSSSNISRRRKDYMESIDDFDDDSQHNDCHHTDELHRAGTFSSVLPHDGTLDLIEENEYTNANIEDSDAGSSKYTSITNPVARSRVAASSLHIRKFSRDHKPSTTLIRESHRRNLNYNNKKNHNTNMKKKSPIRNVANNVTTKCRTNRSRKSTVPPPSSAFQQTTQTTISSDDIAYDNGLLIDQQQQQQQQQQHDIISNSNSIEKFNEVMDEMEEEEDQLHELALTLSKDSNDRKESLNHRLRNFITGDTNIRIRDYLFDVDLPSVPSRDSNISPSKTFD